MQARIIINIALGKGISKTKIPYEYKDGCVAQESLSRMMTLLFEDVMSPFKLLKLFIHPYLNWFDLTAHDKRATRNVTTMRNFLRKVIHDRKARKT